jgi:hypothetical protein
LYRTGDLLSPREDETHHVERGKADAEARARSTRDPSGFFGVWTGAEDGSELLAIAHGGVLFRGG